MAEDEASPRKKPEDVLKLEKALSDRSTCRATGEKIKKGEWRVGIEAWRAGRNTVTWQRALPFLKNCRVEECEKANSGTCKLTGHRFKKGETRFVCSTGDKKIYMSIPAAAEVVQPVIDAEAGSFSFEDIQGLDSISETDRDHFKSEFSQRVGSGPSPDDEKAGEGAEAPPAPKPDPAEGEGEVGAATPAKRRQTRAPGRSRKRVKKEPESDAEADGAGSDEEEEEMEDAEESETAGGASGEGAGGDEVEEGAGPSSPAIPDGIPAYERQRLEIMARNKKRMQALGLQQLAAEIMPKQQPKPRSTKGLAAKRKARQPDGPRRTSLRQKGVAADGQMIAQELRNGQVLLDRRANAGPKPEGTEPQEPEAPRERHPKETIQFKSDNGVEGADERFLTRLRAAAAPSTAKAKAERGSVQLHKLRLKEADVAKVTSNGISHIQWHPSREEPIVAAADKSGNVGLWRVDQEAGESGDDGVLAFKPHGSYVSGLRWTSGAGGCKLFTASYDGSLRCLDPAAGAFGLVLSSEDAEFSAFDCTPDGRLAILGDNDGFLRMYDVRHGSATQRGRETEIHNKRVNTVHFAPDDDKTFVTSSSDCSLAIWDLRKFGSGKAKFLANAVHPKTCQSAYFAPDGSKRVVSLSRDDTVQIWSFDGKSSLTSETVIRHYNNTGRWILPFRATWSPSGDSIVVGNMKRQVDIFSAKTGEAVGGLESEHMTAISSRAAVHPDLKLLAASTASGRVYIFRG